MKLITCNKYTVEQPKHRQHASCEFKILILRLILNKITQFLLVAKVIHAVIIIDIACANNHNIVSSLHASNSSMYSPANPYLADLAVVLLVCVKIIKIIIPNIIAKLCVLYKL